jgi:aspartyl-tRNA(Asn)/glutamyl-tRNA(Gln) amidotransferase subunit C
MKVDIAEVEHVALLARLQLSAAEKEVFTGQLNAILEYVEKLNELDTTGVEATYHVVPNQNVMRQDEVTSSLSPEVSLENAPDQAQGCLRVPKII